MPDIYDQHDKAFGAVSAYVILWGGCKVATIAFKSPKDGAGRLWAYVHWLGLPMVRGCASGYGYDKFSAAVSDAAKRLSVVAAKDRTEELGPPRSEGADWLDGYEPFHTALADDNGPRWLSRLEQAGFDVLRAV